MPDSDSLRIEATSRGPIVYVRLYGAIDETFDVGEILNAGDGKDLIINGMSVTRVSSFGVREWVNGMARLAQAKNRIILYDCSPVLVKQLNMVANFADHCDVVSIRAPYFCESCGWELTVEVTVSVEGAAPPAESMSCTRCGAQMDLDEDPASYYRFAEPNRFRPPEPHIAEFLRSFLVTGNDRSPSAGIGETLVARSRLLWQRIRAHSFALPLAGGIAAGLVLLAIFLAAISGDDGIPPEALQRYHRLLGVSDFAGANGLVNQLAEDRQIPAGLAKSLHDEVAQRRESARDDTLEKAGRLLQQRKYDQALAAYQAAEKLGVDAAELRFPVAECLRKVGRHAEADAGYVKFIESLADGERDSRIDDALFWHADFLIKQGKADEARPLLERVAKTPKSNFRRSARRALSKLKE